MWSERGFDDVTVEEICAAAGVGRTTFYLHFESKEQLLHSLAGATAIGVASELDEVRQTGMLDEHLDVFISGVSRRMTAVPRSLVQLVIQSWRARYARTASDDAVGRRSFADLLGELLLGARDRKEMIATADATELGDILGALTMDAIEAWAWRQCDDRPLEAVLRFRVDLVVNQFRTRKRPPPSWPDEAK